MDHGTGLRVSEFKGSLGTMVKGVSGVKNSQGTRIQEVSGSDVWNHGTRD